MKKPFLFKPKDIVKITTNVHSIVQDIATLAIEHRRLVRVYPFGLDSGWRIETDYELLEQYCNLRGMKPEDYGIEHVR